MFRTIGTQSGCVCVQSFIIFLGATELLAVVYVVHRVAWLTTKRAGPPKPGHLRAKILFPKCGLYLPKHRFSEAESRLRLSQFILNIMEKHKVCVQIFGSSRFILSHLQPYLEAERPVECGY